MQKAAFFVLLTLVCVTLNAQEKTAAVLRQYDKAAALQNEAKYEAAAQEWAAFLAEFPESKFLPQAIFHRAECLYQCDKKKEASELYTQFLAKFPEDDLADDALFSLGICREDLGRPDMAGRDYDRFLEVFSQTPLAPEAAIRRAAILSGEKKHAQAAALYASIAVKWPESKRIAQADLAAGKSYYLAGDMANAEKLLQRAVDAGGPALPEAALWLVRAMIRQDRRAEAMVLAQKLMPKMGDTPQTAELKRDCDALSLGDVEKIEQEGWEQLDRNENAEAEKTFEQVIQNNSGSQLPLRARYGRAVARQRQGKYLPAIEDLEAFLAGKPAPSELSDARYLLGLCQAAIQKTADAAANFQAIVKDDPEYRQMDRVLYEAAWALKKMDKRREAVEAMAALTEKYPNSPLAAEAFYQIGDAAFLAGDFQKAAVAFHQAWQRAGKSELGEKAAHQLGWSYFRLGKFPKAQQTFLFQRGTWPEGPLAGDAAFMEGESLLRQDKREESLTAFERVIAQYPKSTRASLAKQRISDLRGQ